MNEQNEEKWLDELIAGNIDTSKPKFDAESWKRKYAGEFQALVDRRSSRSATRPFALLRLVAGNRITQVAAAAAIIITFGLLIVHLGPGEQEQAGKSPADMVTAMSLRMSYREGGMDALERQCDNSVKVLGRSSRSLPLGDLLRNLNG